MRDGCGFDRREGTDHDLSTRLEEGFDVRPSPGELRIVRLGRRESGYAA